jgi:hypothetical protein
VALLALPRESGHHDLSQNCYLRNQDLLFETGVTRSQKLENKLAILVILARNELNSGPFPFLLPQFYNKVTQLTKCICSNLSQITLHSSAQIGSFKATY